MSSKVKLISISVFGSLIENYDFAIYGFFATVLATLFFPPNNAFIKLLMAYVVFAVGYIIRPIGGVIFGHLADVWGRKAGLVISMTAMGFSLLLISILPTYQQIGFVATGLLILCRVLQGLSVGGEFPGAITFLAEHASIKHRGLISSLAFVGINLGVLCASGVGLLLTHYLTHAQLYEWGWRLAFLLGSILAICGYWIRRQLIETPIFMAAEQRNELAVLPIMHSLRYEGLRILQAVGITAVFAASIPTIFIFMPTYLTDYLHMTMSRAFILNTLSLLIFILFIPISAGISDRYGRKVVLLAGNIGFLILSIPAYYNIQSPHPIIVFMGMCILGVCVACLIGSLVPTLAEFFKTASRSTSVALAYNISTAIFGGCSLIVITALINYTHNLYASAWVMMAVAAISLLSLLTVQFTRMSLSPDKALL